jgi:hypothetical protein
LFLLLIVEKSWISAIGSRGIATST